MISRPYVYTHIWPSHTTQHTQARPATQDSATRPLTGLSSSFPQNSRPTTSSSINFINSGDPGAVVPGMLHRAGPSHQPPAVNPPSESRRNTVTSHDDDDDDTMGVRTRPATATNIHTGQQSMDTHTETQMPYTQRPMTSPSAQYRTQTEADTDHNNLPARPQTSTSSSTLQPQTSSFTWQPDPETTSQHAHTHTTTPSSNPIPSTTQKIETKKPGFQKKKLPIETGWRPWGCPVNIPLREIRDTAWEDEDDKIARTLELRGSIKPREKGIQIDDDDEIRPGGVLKPRLPREYM
jgi:hypothetical protein